MIIYDLMSNSFEEVDYVIKTLKTSDLQEEKTLVLLSSVMTWVNTPPKFEEEKAEGEKREASARQVLRTMMFLIMTIMTMMMMLFS